MDDDEVCLLYKWRYRDVIPNIHRMTSTDEVELWMHLDANGVERYAFGWEQGDENQLRGWVYDYLALAKKETGQGVRDRR